MADRVKNKTQSKTVYVKDGRNSVAHPLAPGCRLTGHYDGYWDPARPSDVYKFRDYIDVDINEDRPDPYGPDGVVEAGGGWKDSLWLQDHRDWQEFRGNAELLSAGGDSRYNKWLDLQPKPPDKGN